MPPVATGLTTALGLQVKCFLTCAAPKTSLSVEYDMLESTKTFDQIKRKNMQKAMQRKPTIKKHAHTHKKKINKVKENAKQDKIW